LSQDDLDEVELLLGNGCELLLLSESREADKRSKKSKREA
jgi:hypothetical protein